LCEIGTFDPVTRTFELSTTDKARCPPGPYPFTIEGCLGEICDQVDVTIDIVDPCLTTALTLGANPFAGYTEHNLGQNTQSLPWNKTGLLTKSTSIDCGPIIVEFYNSNGSIVDPTLFDDTRNGDQTANNFNILETDDNLKVGIYNLKYKVYYQDAPLNS
jgi:hypothetical protein